jgi:methylated-DNA-[protein]-cysteine S-methyltransferase
LEDNSTLGYTMIKSLPFGPVGIVWSFLGGHPKVARIFLSGTGSVAREKVSDFFPDSSPSSCPEIETLASEIKASIGGEAVRFPLNILRLELCSPFQRSVLILEHTVLRGSVTTYRLIAERLRNPDSARAVGNALAKNPFPIIIPCHRVIRSERSLGGYQGGWKMKRALLEAEGILFDRRGRILTEPRK